jgi:hypothetical protein
MVWMAAILANAQDEKKQAVRGKGVVVRSMPKDERQLTPKQQEALLKAAQAFARQVAGDDDTKYIQILEKAYLVAEDPGLEVGSGISAVAMTPRARPRSMMRLDRRDDPNIYRDPTYLKNYRTLLEESPQGTRIVGGRLTAQGEFPDCVAVGDEFDWCCTGTLVAPNVVVTAGHCADGCASRIYVGRDTRNPDPTKIYNVQTALRHEEFGEVGDLIRNDLTVLILDRDVDGVTPRKIAAAAAIDAAAWLRVVGFGTTDLMGTTGYGRQRRVDVAIASPSCSDSATQSRYGCLGDREIVAGTPNRDSCRGDSGGPAYVRASDGTFALAGATSRAIRGSRYPCGGGGIYVRIDRYADWIKEVTAAHGGHWPN